MQFPGGIICAHLSQKCVHLAHVYVVYVVYVVQCNLTLTGGSSGVRQATSWLPGAVARGSFSAIISSSLCENLQIKMLTTFLSFPFEAPALYFVK